MKKPVPMTHRAHDCATRRKENHTPSTWSPDSIDGYWWGVYEGYMIGYRAALRAAKKKPKKGHP